MLAYIINLINIESLAHQGCIYLKNTEKKQYIAISNIGFLFNTYTLKYNLFLWSKTEFSASLLQSSVSPDLQKSFWNAELLSVLLI